MFQGVLTSPPTGAASATAGKPSQPHNFAASSFSSSTSTAVKQTFQWKAEPAGNNTAAPSATLNLLFGSGTGVPTETGVKVSSNGLFTFASGQTFPGNGTITGVTAGSGLTGGGATGSVTLSLLKTCATNQVLEWNGTAWACATVSGSGTITGVTAGSGLTGGGTTGNVTLNLNTAALQIANDARYAQLGAANAFTQPLTINSTKPIEVQSTSSASGAAVIYGHPTDTSGATSAGVLGIADAPSVLGVFGASNGSAGIGVEGKGAMNGVLGFFSAVSTIWDTYGAHGDTCVTNGVGVLGRVDGGYGVKGISAGTQLNTAGTYGAAGPPSGYGGIAGVWGDAANHVWARLDRA